MLKLSSIVFFFFLHHTIVTGAIFNCEYVTTHWIDAEIMHTCRVKDSEIFNNSRVMQFDAIARNRENVTGLSIMSIPSLKYFPSNTELFFDNLIGISIHACSLQEIHQSDLMPFVKLKHLRLNDNKIKVIDENLFKFNTELKTIFLDKNEISYIDPNVFDHLTSLSVLDLTNNNCEKFFNKAKKRSEVLSYVKSINNGKCSSIEVIADRYRKLNAEHKKLVEYLELTKVTYEIHHNQTFDRADGNNVGDDTWKFLLIFAFIIGLAIGVFSMLIYKIRADKKAKVNGMLAIRQSDVVNNSLYEEIVENNCGSLSKYHLIKE